MAVWVAMVGLLVLGSLIWLHYRENEKDEAHFGERKDREDDLSASFRAEKGFSGSRTEEEKAPDTTTAGAVKYGRGFGKNGGQQKEKAPKETEDFYRYDRKENDRIACPGCGVENAPDSTDCLLCGMPLRSEGKGEQKNVL